MLQEHMYLQRILLHMNEIENTSTNNSDNIRNERIDATDYVNKIWNKHMMKMVEYYDCCTYIFLKYIKESVKYFIFYYIF